MRMMMWRRLRGSNDERGVVMVIVVLSLVAIFAMVVLTVDVGGLLLKRRALVNGSDAAALAAAESCALGANHVFTNVSGQPTAGTPESRADQFATANVDGDLNASATNIVASQTVNCTTTQPNPASGPGHVTVAYQGNQPLYFAQVLGFGNTSVVGFQSTAAWGPAGSGIPLPISLNLNTFQGSCDVPNVPQGTQCYVWYDNDLFNGSNFGFIDLDPWNVDPNTFHCNKGGGASQIGTWIDQAGGAKTGGLDVNLNYPSPTYVCTDSGQQTNSWKDHLLAFKGQILFFPINDKCMQLPVASRDTTCPTPGTGSGQADFLDIIGFASLQLDDVLSVQDAGGTSPTTCTTHMDLNTNQTVFFSTVGGGGCPGGLVPTSVSNLTIDGTACQAPNCSYDNSSFTWTGNQTNRAQVSFTWSVAGRCGPPPPDSSAQCLLVTWQGVQVGGGNPGGGGNFGLQAIRLCDPSLSGSCPTGS